MKKTLPILLLCVLCLTGCSSTVDPTSDVTVTWNNGVIEYKGKDTGLTEYSGYEASIENGGGGLSYRISLDSAKDVTNISVNTQGILEENMDTYKGMFYYTEYLGSEFTAARNISGEDWAVCQVLTNDLTPATIANYAYEYLTSVPLTNGQVYVDFGDFTFGNDYDAVIVRTDCALIYGTAKVSAGTYDTTTTVSIMQDNKEYQLQKGSSSKYDYYVYDGYVIQVAAGLDVSSYITFD